MSSERAGHFLSQDDTRNCVSLLFKKKKNIRKGMGITGTDSSSLKLRPICFFTFEARHSNILCKIAILYIEKSTEIASNLWKAFKHIKITCLGIM